MPGGSEALCLRASVSNEGRERWMQGLCFTNKQRQLVNLLQRICSYYLDSLLSISLHSSRPPPSQRTDLVLLSGWAYFRGLFCRSFPRSPPPFILTAYDCLSKSTSKPETLCMHLQFLTTAVISLKPLSIVVFSEGAETQSKAWSFNYTQSVLSIISNQTLITSGSGAQCCCLYISIKTQLTRQSPHAGPSDERMQTGSFQLQSLGMNYVTI